MKAVPDAQLRDAQQIEGLANMIGRRPLRPHWPANIEIMSRAEGARPGRLKSSVSAKTKYRIRMCSDRGTADTTATRRAVAVAVAVAVACRDACS